jgi:predicted HicB family RNase H-like nuclease
MIITIDIPEPIFRQLEARAQVRGMTLNNLVSDVLADYVIAAVTGQQQQA